MKTPSASGLRYLTCPTLCAALVAACLGLATPGWSQTRQTLVIRGHAQSLYVYGNPRGDPVIVSSGDGGWIHLGPHVAEFLSRRGFFVVGFDVRAYLESFTSGGSTLRPQEEPGDYEVLAEFARKATGKNPILIGVSEGAGLSVLAATDGRTKAAITGVIGLGLPDLNELGWRWRDAVIYLTHRTPQEPLFSTAAIVDRMTPIPLAVIHSTHDEFVPVAEVEKVFQSAKDPKRLWTITASDHRFSDNLNEFDQRLLEAMAWTKVNSPR
jgi:pimeloyl-ACP methyl ester carboxylesterase